MDSFYPEDLCNGLHPLVFVVSVINEKDDGAGGCGSLLYDRFFNAISTSSSGTANPEQNVSSAIVNSDASVHNMNTASKNSTNRNVALFRGDEDDDEHSSDDDDDFLIDSFGNGPVRKKGGHGFGFGRRNSTGRNASIPDSSSSFDLLEYNVTTNTSFIKTLKNGQAFFDHARIVNISTRYGFPPSKDPEGTQNLAFELNNILKQPIRRGVGGSAAAVAAAAERQEALSALFQTYPISGIIPSGWLAKHVHALPSAILVVCTVSSSQKDQAEQDRRLFETIEHLQYSIVPKRQCSIQVVGLMKDEVSIEQGAEWSRAITQDLVLEDNVRTPFTVTLLRSSTDLTVNENMSTMDKTEALQKLHGTIRDASHQYYRQQARRTKDKLQRLTDDQRKSGPPPIALTPLIVRYCFKIATFYEFLLCYEKTFRFLVEAYRSIARYYLHLMIDPNQSTKQKDSLEGLSTVSLNADSTIIDSNTSRFSPINEEGIEVVETEMTANPVAVESIWSALIASPPDDMVHQCRTVADWLNFKLLSLSLKTCTNAGVLAAAQQWRQHSRIFATRQYASKLPVFDSWFDWSYISRQRIVASILMELYLPNIQVNLELDSNDSLFRCSPWRAYMSAAEGILCLGKAVEQVKAREKIFPPKEASDKSDTGVSRARYIGSVASDSLRKLLLKECSVPHREIALDNIVRSIRLFESEQVEKRRGFYAEDESIEKTSSRTGARLYYLAGGVLLGMAKHEEAANYLLKALKACRGWQSLELVIRRLLVECYEHSIPSQSDSRNESSANIVSMILYSYFNAELSSQNLRKALDHLAAVSGGKTLQWYQETTDDEDCSLPFSFAVSFPGKTQSRSGDTVAASIVIKSNLNYAVHVNSVALGTLAGKLGIPSHDLLSAINASEGSEGGIIIQANTAIIISTKVVLPKDLSAIAFDESGNGGELLGVAGKGSFAKIAKPRTAGITAAGGARLVSEERLQRGNSNSQGWNLRFLGGKPLLCEGLHLTFYPVQAEVSSADKVISIELTIQKKKVKTTANIKRTPFEEENYIASAWSRPQHLPFSRGPRSLRVLGPQAELVVTNITDELTNGKALEGTVNRILLKLQAGLDEHCVDLKINISCFSVFITPTGTTKRLVSREELSIASDNSLDMSNPSYRTPSFVESSKSDEIKSNRNETYVGYDLPVGWTFAGTGQQYSDDCIDLKRGESSYLELNFYRPAAYSRRQLLSSDDINNDEHLGDVSLCKTDYYVSITYKQERPSANKQIQQRQRRSIRSRPVMASGAKGSNCNPDEGSVPNEEAKGDNEVSADIVSLDWSGSLLWAPPIAVTFSRGAQFGYPCGIGRAQHYDVANELHGQAENSDFILTDGEKLSTRCSLQLDTSTDAIQTEIVAVRYEGNENTDSHVSTVLTSKVVNDDSDCIYRSSPDDPSRILSTGSKLTVSYTIAASLLHDSISSATSSLGSILVDWRPYTCELPLTNDPLIKVKGEIKPHGPLALATPSTIRFTGPNCCIKRAPFKAEALDLPPHVTVAKPFDIKYTIVNKTRSHQSLTIQMYDENASNVPGLLLSGCMKGKLTLGPLEKQTLSYRAIACHPGEIKLPPLCVSSDRYKSWIINERSVGRRCLYVFP